MRTYLTWPVLAHVALLAAAMYLTVREMDEQELKKMLLAATRPAKEEN